MIELFSIILVLILFSKYIEDRTKIPFVLLVILLSSVAHYLFDFTLLSDNFEGILYLMLPIILIPDVLGISRSELQENISQIIFLAVIAVIISIVFAVTSSYLFSSRYNFTFIELMVLFTPLMATDVVSVGAIFSKFKLPEQLKLYAEGESLFNDITAMILFFFIAMPFLNGGDLSFTVLSGITIYTLLSSVIIGLILGIAGYLSFKYSRDNFEEFISIYLMASLAFVLAEISHSSSILSVVISVMFFKYLFDKEGHYKKKNYAAILMDLNKKQESSYFSLRAYKKEAYYLGLFANAIIFISIVNVIDLTLLLRYKVEIIGVFLLTTLIRFVMMYAFTLYNKHPFNWSVILTFSGMKGGLALIMVVSLDESFRYKEMFLAITLGVVFLSIFLYTFALMFYLRSQKEMLIIDKAKEHHMHIHNIKDLVEKEQSSGAYNVLLFEDFIEKEIHRAQRYNLQFSIVTITVDENKIKKLSKNFVRESDYLGKLDNNDYAILLTHTTLEEAFIVVEKIKKEIGDVSMSIVQYTTGDSKEMLFEKLDQAMKEKKNLSVEI